MTMSETTVAAGADGTANADFDVVIIGAGFGGLAALKELRGGGFSVRAVDAASEVGGTWYWNRYPGLRVDSESRIFCYSTDPELLEEWDWPP